MDYKHIVFDVDGTLVDTEDTTISSLQDALLILTGKKPSREELHFALGITGEDVLRRLGLDMETGMQVWLAQLTHYEGCNRLYPGIEELLKTLQQQGCRLGVATSRTHLLYDAEIPGLGIAGYFGEVICAEDSQTHKPEAGPLEAYMQRTGAAPEEVLYIGDSVYDMLCARNAGTGFLLAGWGALPELREQAPAWKAEPLQVLDFLQERKSC